MSRAGRGSAFGGVLPILRWREATTALALLAAAAVAPLGAQEARIRDLAILDGAVPTRLVGYGLVVGLDGSGDRVTAGSGGGATVRSVTNLLRRFDIEVPEDALRTRNAAAVLVTAELSPWLRSGGRFEVQVASLGDATSLRGGVLWMTPLTADVGGEYVATAQGPVLLPGDEGVGRSRRLVETSARIPDGGVLELDLPRPTAGGDVVILRSPDLVTAARVAEAINGALGEGTARVLDPGTVHLATAGEGEDPALRMARIAELRVLPDAPARVVVNAASGTVAGGGDLAVGPAVVSHAGFTLAVGGQGDGGGQGSVRLAAGARVQDVTAALHDLGATAHDIAAILEGLRQAGALPAEVVVR